MKKYIGTKIIEAEPAYRVVDAEGNVRVVTEAAEAKRCGTVDLGYKVRYPDGYESFSPKGAFDDAYHPINGMNFGLAIEALRKGFRVRRRGWNGKGIFIELQTSDAYSYPDGLDMELLVKPPYDELYVLYLEAKIDAENGEYNKYQNSLQLYNNAYGNFLRWFAGTYDPVQGYKKEA